MDVKKIVFLFLLTLTSTCIQAQEIREITVEKPGKLMKQIKKEVETITKLKVTGILNCEDMDALSRISNLEYLDLRGINFAFGDKHNDTNHDRERHTLFFHGSFPKLKVLYLAPTNYTEVRQEIFSNIYVSTIHTEGCISGNIAADTIYIHGNGEASNSMNAKHMIVIDRIDQANKILNKVIKATPIVAVAENGWIGVSDWRGPITREQSRKISYFTPHAFSGNKEITEFEFNDDIQSIPDDAFKGCSNLKTVIFGKNLKEIGHRSFISTQIKSIDVPASVEKISSGAFDESQLSEIKVHTQNAPAWLDALYYLKFKGHLYVPDGAYVNYEKWRTRSSETYLEDMIIHDNKITGGSYKINLPKGGTILSHISLDNLMTADSLTISGVLYEIDFEFLKKARRLTYLDISNCYSTYSEDALKGETQRRQEIAALFTAISDGLDAEYVDEKIGTLEYKANKYIADEISKAYSEGVSNHNMCLIPEEALKGMPALKTLKLPILVTMIGPHAFHGCKKLEEVTFPPFLKRIGKGAFAYCHSLGNVHIPKTVNWIQYRAFYNCNSITSFIFPGVKDKKEFSFEDDILGACVSLEEIVYPEGLEEVPLTGKECYSLKKVYFPSTAKTVKIESREWDDPMKVEQCEFHFKSLTPPELIHDHDNFGNKAIICVPKGTITKYMAKYGEGGYVLKVKYKYEEE